MTEENPSLVKCAEEISEVFADSVSSLVLMLVALQEKNKPPKPELHTSIQLVSEQSINIADISKNLAIEDYEEYPEIQKEILDASNEVLKGSNDLIQASKDLSSNSSNLKEGYRLLVEGCRLCGTNCIKLLQIVYGASFKKLAVEHENIKELSKKLDIKLAEENPEQFVQYAGDLCTIGLQISEDMKTQSQGESIPSAKEEMEELSLSIEKLSNAYLDAVNAYFEDPDNEELKKEMVQAKIRLEEEIEKSKSRVMKSHEIVKQQQAVMNEQTALVNASIDDKIKNVKPSIPKEEQLQRGFSCLEHLDQMADAVFWNNPKQFVPATNENIQNIPSFIDGRIGDAQRVKKTDKIGNIQKIKDNFQEFVDKSKEAFSDPNNENKKKEALENYKNTRELLIGELKELGCNEEKLPEMPQIEENKEINQEENLTKDVENIKKIPKEKIEKIKSLYDQINAMQYAIDSSDNNLFVNNAKILMAELPIQVKLINEDAIKTKDIKKKKISEKLNDDFVPAINESKASLADKSNEQKKILAKEKLEKLKTDLIEIISNEGISKKHVNNVLSEKKIEPELIKNVKKLKEEALQIIDAVNNKNSNNFVKTAKETVPNNKNTSQKIKEYGTKENNPVLISFADALERRIIPAINSSKASITEPNNKQKLDEANKSVEDYINFLNELLKSLGATPDEINSVIFEKPDSDIVKKTKKTKECLNKIKDCLIEGDMEELADAIIDFDNSQNELIKQLNEEIKKSGNKDNELLLEKAKNEYNEAFDAIKKSKKNSKDKEARKIAEEKLEKYQETIDEILNKNGKPPKASENYQKKVNDDLNRILIGLENNDFEKVKEGLAKLNKDIEKLKEEKEKEGNKINDDILNKIKEIQNNGISYVRDPKNEEKKNKILNSIKECKNVMFVKPQETNKIDDIKENNKELIKKSQKTKGSISKLKMAMYDDPICFTDALTELKETEKELIKALDESAKKSGKNNKDEINKIETLFNEAIDSVRKAKKTNDKKDFIEAENKLDLIDIQAETFLSNCGKPSKEIGKKARKTKEVSKKVEYAFDNRDSELFNDSSKNLIDIINETIKHLNSNGQAEKAKEISGLTNDFMNLVNESFNEKIPKKDKEVKEKLKKIRDIIDDVLLINGEPISETKKGNDEIICKDVKDLKDCTDQLKSLIELEDALLLDEGIKKHKNKYEALIKTIEESDAIKDNLKLKDLLKKAEIIENEVEEILKRVKEEPENKKLKSDAEKKLNELESILNDILKEQGIPVKESAKCSKRLKEKLNKLQNTIINNDPETYEELKKDIIEEQKLLKLLMDKEKSDFHNKIYEDLDKLMKNTFIDCEESFKDPKNKSKKEKALKTIENTNDIINDTIILNGEEVVKINKINNAKDILNNIKNVKNDTSKLKEGLYLMNPKIIEETMNSLKDNTEDLISELESIPNNNKDNEKIKEIIEKIKKATIDSENKIKEAQNKKDPKSIYEAEKSINELNNLCNEVREILDRPTKEGSKSGQITKEKISKVINALETNNIPLFEASIKELKEEQNILKKILEEEGNNENDQEKIKMAKELFDEIQKFIDEAIATKSNPSLKESMKEKGNRLKKSIDKLMIKEGEPSYGLKDSEVDVLNEIEELAESIILNPQEEAYILIDDILKAQRKVQEALKEGNEEKLKDAKEELDKKIKMKNDIIDKAIQKCSPNDREILREINKKLDENNNELLKITDEALNDKKLKEKLPLVRKLCGDSAKIIQPMKSLLSDPTEIKAVELFDIMKDDCSTIERVTKEGNEKKIKELKKKINKDIEKYEQPILKLILQEEGINKAEKDKLEKLLNEIKEKEKILEESLEKLSKNPKDKNLQDEVIKNAKELDKLLNSMNDNIDIQPKAKCIKTAEKIDKVKAAVIIKDKELGDKSLNELKKESNGLVESIIKTIEKEKDQNKQKELEEAKNNINQIINEVENKTKKSLNSDDDFDIDSFVLSCTDAKIEIEKTKELLKGGKSKSTNKNIQSEKMKYLAAVRKAIQGKNFEVGTDALKKLKDLINNDINDDNIDEETKIQMQEFMDKIELTMNDVDLMKDSNILDEMDSMLGSLDDLSNNNISDEAKAKSKARGLAARAKNTKKSDLSSLINASKDLSNKMKNLKQNLKEESHENIDQLSDSARAALALDDMFDDISNGIDLDGLLGDMKIEEEVVVEEEKPKNSLESELLGVANLIKQTATDESKPKATGKTKEMVKIDAPVVCNDISIHFKELAKMASSANKEGIIVEGKTISASLSLFCKDLEKAQPSCKDRIIADDIARSLATLKNLSTQLKILCSVKAATVGKGDVEGDNQLISICKNIGECMKAGIESISVANRTKILSK